MSIITMAQSKGGAGKTTIAQLLVGVMQERGFSVGVIDADVNHTLASWLENFAKLDRVEHYVVERETEIVSKAQEFEKKHDLVVIDTAGAKNQATLYAIGVADLVLIPVQLSSANVIEAVNTYRAVESTSKMVKREILARVVLTDYTPKTNIAKHIKKEVKAVGLPMMKTKLHRLVAFQELSYGEVPSKGTAGAQAQLLVQEIEKMEILPFTDEIRVAV